MDIIHGGGCVLARCLTYILTICIGLAIPIYKAHAVTTNEQQQLRYEINTNDKDALYTYLYNGYFLEPKKVHLRTQYTYCGDEAHAMNTQERSAVKKVNIYQVKDKGKKIVLSDYCYGLFNHIKKRTQKKIDGGNYARFQFAGRNNKLFVNTQSRNSTVKALINCFSCFLLKRLKLNKFRGDINRNEMLIVFHPINTRDSFIDIFVPVE